MLNLDLITLQKMSYYVGFLVAGSTWMNILIQQQQTKDLKKNTKIAVLESIKVELDGYTEYITSPPRNTNRQILFTDSNLIYWKNPCAQSLMPMYPNSLIALIKSSIDAKCSPELCRQLSEFVKYIRRYEFLQSQIIELKNQNNQIAQSLSTKLRSNAGMNFSTTEIELAFQTFDLNYQIFVDLMGCIEIPTSFAGSHYAAIQLISKEIKQTEIDNQFRPSFLQLSSQTIAIMTIFFGSIMLTGEVVKTFHLFGLLILIAAATITTLFIDKP